MTDRIRLFRPLKQFVRLLNQDVRRDHAPVFAAFASELGSLLAGGEAMRVRTFGER